MAVVGVSAAFIDPVAAIGCEIYAGAFGWQAYQKQRERKAALLQATA